MERFDMQTTREECIVAHRAELQRQKRPQDQNIEREKAHYYSASDPLPPIAAAKRACHRLLETYRIGKLNYIVQYRRKLCPALTRAAEMLSAIALELALGQLLVDLRSEISVAEVALPAREPGKPAKT
jgi:hypothetical protein